MFRHSLRIELETHLSKDEELESLVKAILGPWCSEVKILRLNIPSKEDKDDKISEIQSK